MARKYVARKYVLALVFAFVGLMTIAAAGFLVTAQEFYTIYDGETAVTVSGNFQTVADVLTAADITTRPEDTIYPALTEHALSSTPIQIQRALPVTVRTEADSQIYWTLQPTLGAFLSEAGIILERTDQVSADGRSVTFNTVDQTPLPKTIEIGQFLNITVTAGENQQTIRTAAQTVGEALKEVGIEVFAADGVDPPLGTWLEPEMTITVKRSAPVTIMVDGRVIQTRSHHTNARDILASAGVSLIGYDYTIPDENTPIQPNDTIQVVRVTEDFQIQDEEIAYQTLWQASDELIIDNKAVISAGSPGILRKRIRVRYENGVPVSETVDGEWIAKEPVNQVIGYGTKIEIGVINTEQGPREYWRLVRMRVTSYTAASSGKAPDHPAYGLTASGLPAQKGVVAIDRAVVPFRSEVFVPGYGVAIAGDTGGGVRGRWIDLGFGEDDYESWSGYVDVYYLTPVPPPDKINYLIPEGLP